jgi:hypothetical protein
VKKQYSFQHSTKGDKEKLHHKQEQNNENLHTKLSTLFFRMNSRVHKENSIMKLMEIEVDYNMRKERRECI